MATDYDLADLFSYILPDTPKMLKETLCVAQQAYGQYRSDNSRWQEHMDRLQRMIDECDRMRPVGPDGKHNDRHTPNCGCGRR